MCYDRTRTSLGELLPQRIGFRGGNPCVEMTPHEQCVRQMERIEHPRIVCPVCSKTGDTRNPSKALVVGIMVRGN